MEDNENDKMADAKNAKKSSRQHDGGAADLEKVTDYEEERVVLSQDITGVSIEIFSCISDYF